MATLREILAKFSVSFDDTELKKGDKGVQALFDKLKKVGGLLAGGVIGAKLRDMTMELANQGDALAKQSDALGVSMKDLQGWHYAAEGAGVAAEEFNGALTKFGQAIVNASGGTGPAAEAFRKLGVSVKDSAGNLGEPIELIDGVVAGLENIEHPAKRAEAVMALFGKSGTKLLPLFSQGAEGIAKIRAEVEQLGGGFSPEFAKSAAAMNDEIARLNMAWLSFKVRVGGLVIPLISRFVTVVTKTTAWVTKLGKSSYLLESAFVVVGAAAVVMGRKMALAGLRALVPWLPMIAAMAALVLVSDELITLWNGGDTLIGRAIDNIFGEGSAQKAVEWVKGVIKNVEELFDGNDRALADFFGGLELMWFDFTTWLEGGWQQLWTAMKLLCYDTFTTPRGGSHRLATRSPRCGTPPLTAPRPRLACSARCSTSSPGRGTWRRRSPMPRRIGSTPRWERAAALSMTRRWRDNG